MELDEIVKAIKDSDSWDIPETDQLIWAAAAKEKDDGKNLHESDIIFYTTMRDEYMNPMGELRQYDMGDEDFDEAKDRMANIDAEELIYKAAEILGYSIEDIT